MTVKKAIILLLPTLAIALLWWLSGAEFERGPMASYFGFVAMFFTGALALQIEDKP